MTAEWRQDGDDLVLESSLPVFGRRGPRVGPSGIEAGLLRRKRWHWPEIAAVTWDRDDYAASLAVCIHGDPWVKKVPLPLWMWDSSWDQVRALLAPISAIVEAMGARVENRDEPATDWWHLHPDARRR
ncbi:MAG TPA: hypothetical protein VM942_08365 [Acidimicrobiales bacterium]|nr:hypothetical protein [Acidimicrobiales bacterium]